MDEQELQKIRETAAALDEIAEDLERMSGENEFGERLRAGWKSDNASLFLKKHDKLQGEIRKTAKEIRLAVESMRELFRRS